MALTLAQKDALTTSAALLGRVRQACREYAAYLRALGGSATAEQSAWARQVLETGRVAQIAADLAGELVTDSAFADASDPDASDVADSALKAAVEAIAVKYT